MTEQAARAREATPADRDFLVECARAMALETEHKELDLATVRAGVASLLADAARGRVFVAEADGAPAATLMLTYEWSDWRDGFFWWIQSVYVVPSHRRRGLYRLLHEHVRALAARTDGVYGLRLYVERDNVNAQATYRRMGMEETPYLIYEEAVRRG
ncbi:GNAT family N-acetyltransferase [Candidatus Binatia bacterium]|jgi:GNAT superfamily N-acetyltransferase|nr:GNAT family N-acetyltransferase [Candidatus Binatia bacterium]